MPDPTLTLDKFLADIKRALAEIGPPPPEVRISPYATALPSAEPRTDDMRQMVDRLGQARVPAAFRLSGRALGLAHDVVVVHPDLIPKDTPDA